MRRGVGGMRGFSAKGLRALLRLAEGVGVMVLPDFFLDRIVKLPSWYELSRLIVEKARVGGGSIHGIEQMEVRGGNASNMAYALGRLGLRTRLIVCADTFGEAVLKRSFEALRCVELSVHPGRQGFTTALEFKYGKRWVNVMLSDTGHLSEFGPERMSSDDWKALESCSMVVVTNWAANSSGDELALKVFRKAKAKGARTYLAPADITATSRSLGRLLKVLVREGLLDVLSLNEVEAGHLAKETLGINRKLELREPHQIKDLADGLSSSLGIRVDLHTLSYTSSSDKGRGVVVPCFRVEAKISTGAGDVWDAANILGYMAGLEPKERLLLANLAASLFVASPNGTPPTREELLKAIKEL